MKDMVLDMSGLTDFIYDKLTEREMTISKETIKLILDIETDYLVNRFPIT